MSIEKTAKDEPTMFHYLLEMHKGGASLACIELNVPIESFPASQAMMLKTAENLLLDYGKRMGFDKSPGAPTVTP